MTATILSIILAAIGLATLIIKACLDKSKEKKEKQDAEDKRIDSISNADDTLAELDRLRNEPPANRP